MDIGRRLIQTRTLIQTLAPTALIRSVVRLPVTPHLGPPGLVISGVIIESTYVSTFAFISVIDAD